MNKLQFEALEGTIVRLARADNDAVIKGWDQDTIEILLDGDLDQCTARQQQSTLDIESLVAVSISVPKTAIVNAGEISGDLVLRNLSGQVSVGTVHGETLIQSGDAPVSMQATYGDLTADQWDAPLSVAEVHADVRLNQVGAPITLGTVHGDVRARALGASLEMGSVNGDVRVREVSGVVALEEGHGDFKGSDLQGGMNVHEVKGDLSLKTALTPGLTYRGQANGDISVRLPEGTSARFVLQADGALHAKLPQIEEQKEGQLVGQAGDGKAQVELYARGDLSLKIRGYGDRRGSAFEIDFGGDIAAQIEAQIAESLDGIDIDALAQREIDKAMRKAGLEIEKAKLRAEHETHRAQERIHRAQERAARAAKRAHEKISRRSHRWTGGTDGRTFTFRAGRSAPKPQATEGEQLAILKMIQEGKITAQEAEQLLKALEG